MSPNHKTYEACLMNIYDKTFDRSAEHHHELATIWFSPALWRSETDEAAADHCDTAITDFFKNP